MNQARLVERFIQYVRCPSESRREREFCLLVEQELNRLGVPFTRDEVGEACGSNGWNIHAMMPGEGEPILLCAHMDTVSPGVGITPQVENGVIRSAGDTVLGADDKAAVAAIFETMESLRESGATHRPIELLFTICEELGLEGSKHADFSNIRSKQAIVLDHDRPGALIHRSPINVHLHVEVTGKSAHAAANFNAGVHALKAAARAVAEIPIGYIDDESVANISNFFSPGESNIVPSQACFDMEIRSFSEEALQLNLANTRRIVEAVCAQAGASCNIAVTRHAELLDVPPNAPVIGLVKKHLATLGVECELGSTYGCSDTAYLFSHGLEAVNIGVGMQAPHGVSEQIAVADLVLTVKLLLSIVCDL